MPSCTAAVGRALRSALVLGRSGLLGPYRPDAVAGIIRGFHRYGASPATGYAVQAALDPSRTAIVDDVGRLTFSEVDERTTALAAALVRRGLAEGDRAAILARNHRGFIEGTVALAKAGVDTVYLNTGFSGPQLADVVRRERVRALLLDDEFLPAAAALPAGIPLVLSWGRASPGDATGAGGPTDFDALVSAARAPAAAASPPFGEARRPRRPSRQIILTSGTSGTPRGADRSPPGAIGPLVGLLSGIPLRRHDTTLVAAPMFHAWGLAHLALGLVFGSTLVLRRRFDPEETLRLVAAERVSVLAAVPVMLQRIMELPDATRRRYDTSSLRVIALSGSPLPGSLATRVMDAFGDIVYNLYGSTEVAWVSIAGPADLRRAPGTAGRPPLGTVVQLLDDSGRPVPTGSPGRIFAANAFAFAGYTDGSGRQVIRGLVDTGDVGHLDADGLLFVDGREDDMIVSGGENVFPREVEDLLAGHPAVEEVTVVGRPDEAFGQRLEAFVVRRPGRGVTEDELRGYVGANLARYKVPRRVVFVDRLPRNATGKILKRGLGAEVPPG